jgi:deoxyribose-phosphate aldolase
MTENLQITPKILASLIDHTQLMPFATCQDIKKLCEEASQLETATVCVNESRVEEAVRFLNEYNMKNSSNVKVCCVIGFPLGSATTNIKIASAIDAIHKGAREIDMVINIGFLKDGMKAEGEEKIKLLSRFKQDIEAVMEAIDNYNQEHSINIILKVIQENCYLEEEEIKIATTTIAKLAGNFKLKVFAKTSTGFGVPKKGPIDKEDVGSTENDIKIMANAIKEITKGEYLVGIKAAGGIRDKETTLKMLKAAGCIIEEDGEDKLVNNYKELFRIGASATKDICK